LLENTYTSKDTNTDMDRKPCCRQDEDHHASNCYLLAEAGAKEAIELHEKSYAFQD